MANKFRALVVSHDDDFREELVERTISLGLSVRAIGRPDGLPHLLRRYDFGWLLLDLAVDENTCLGIIEGLAAAPAPPRAILIAGRDRTGVDAVRGAATRLGLEVVEVLTKPLSFPHLQALLEEVPAGDREPAEADPDLGPVTAIPSEEIVLHYQPIVGLGDRAIHRVEALVRWQHPQLGLIRPVRFIGLFERADTIVPLTWAVLERAVAQHAAWKREGLLLPVSVNISALFLASLQTAEEILALLGRLGCEPRHLTLEITETESVVNPPVARALLTRLREAEVEVSMDDYGVGFATVERLHYYPFSDLKIDRGLVGRLDSSPDARQVVERLVSLANRDQFTLTGEGIETQEQWNVLERLGCTFGQGFLIARPMPAEQIGEWIERMMQDGRYWMAPPR